MLLTFLVGSSFGGSKTGLEVLLYGGCQMYIVDGGLTQRVREAVGARLQKLSI